MIFEILCTCLFGNSDWLYIITGIVFMAARCAVLKKCGVRQYWQGAIPIYGEYVLARCVNRETEGFSLAVLNTIGRVLNIAIYFISDENLILLLGTLMLPLLMVTLVYDIRVYIGVCDLFGRKHRWLVFLFMFDTFSFVLLYWGLNKKDHPRWSLEEVDSVVTDFFSTSKAAVMEKGLTVNLEERSAKEGLKKHVLLRDVHMYIKPGSMVLLLGGSGAGKTTLLNAINGYESAKADIHLNGRNVYSEYKQMQYDIGFVPQLDLMRGSDTVLHTLTDAAALRLPSEMHATQRKERIEMVMGIFGLKPVANNMVSKLSGGQRKRLSIAMEFLSNPSLFILDEPDSGLDGVMARELMQQLRIIADQGKIVIVITHTPDRVIDLFDDVIVLAKDKERTGRLAYYGSISDARTFFGKDTMEHIVLSINRQEEGGEGRADEFIAKYAEVIQHA